MHFSSKKDAFIEDRIIELNGAIYDYTSALAIAGAMHRSDLYGCCFLVLIGLSKPWVIPTLFGFGI